MTAPMRELDLGPLRSLCSEPEARPTGAERTPVLCFLHGYDEAAPMELGRAMTRNGPLAVTAAPEARSRFIVVAPQLPTAGDLWYRYADAVVDLVRRIHSDHAGDPDRTYLTGFSFGGNGVLDLALREPDLWAALWPVDPTRAPMDDPRLPVWLSSGQVSRLSEAAWVARLALRPPDPAPGDRVLVDAGLDHARTATAAYADPAIYRWLLSHRRNEEAPGAR